MGTMIGLIAKKNEQICFTKGVFTVDAESLSSHLNNIESVNNKFLENFEGNERTKEWLKLSEFELNSLKLNFIQDFADDQLEYFKSINEDIPENFSAMGYNGVHEYDEKYLEYESWSQFRVFTNALEKVIKMSTLNLSSENKNTNESIQLHNSIMILEGIRESLYTIYAPTELAILCGPF